jgi:hypothetical protein
MLAKHVRIRSSRDGYCEFHNIPTRSDDRTGFLAQTGRPHLVDGNLYFTSHDGSIASVWRTAQRSSPGQELLLWSEPGVRFGDIVYAQVDGIW